jgi:hypothetical protein
MASCTEAKYFLQNCPGVEMDGDHDGMPCEEQCCTSPFAKQGGVLRFGRQAFAIAKAFQPGYPYKTVLCKGYL